MLGRTGRNFAAGMSGGIAYVLDPGGTFARRCNTEMVDLEPLTEIDDVDAVLSLLRRHVEFTGSAVGARVLKDWAEVSRQFMKVMPRDYKRVLAAQAKAAAAGRDASFNELVGVAANG